VAVLGRDVGGVRRADRLVDLAAQVAPIDKLSVVPVAIFGAVFLGERLTAPN
jgi:transporter family protein